MEAWLVVQSEDGSTRDLAVRAPSTSTVDEVAAAVAGALRAPAGGTWALYSHRLAAWLPGHLAAAAVDLRHGDVVALAAAASPAGVQGAPAPLSLGGPSLVQVTVTAGAQLGQAVGLAAGDHVLGRASSAAIILADPFVAPEHARLTVAADRITVTDLGSEGGTVLDGAPVRGTRAVRAGQVLEVGGTSLVVEALREPSADLAASSNEVPFNRPPRVIQGRGGEVHRLAVPPDRPRRPRLPLVTALVPLLMGGAMLFFIHNALTLVFLAMSPVLAIGSYVESRMGGRGDYRRAAAEFRSHLDALVARLQATQVEEIRRRRDEA
ncbi:MAG: FHA domain-containing protein, partial [Candidatus Dormibacteraeota bacterium]|nr:FHA domain-containing protein [Candidatus Dormibacteraeota bacterium]